MRNWEEFVRGRLSLPELTPEREARIVRELAAQLEDFYRDALARGLSEADADAHARRQIRNWRGLAAEVRDADRPNVKTYLERLEERAETRNARRTRGRWGWDVIAQVGQDLRYALRQFQKSPGFTAVAVLTLALGIGATTSIFSVVNAVLLRPPAYAEPDRLVRVWTRYLSRGFSHMNLTESEFLFYQQNQQAFEGLAAYYTSGANLSRPDRVSRVVVRHATPNFFSLLGVAPIADADFSRPDPSGNRQVAIISCGLWHREFGGPKTMSEEFVQIDGRPYRIVGILPPSFEFPPEQPDVWVPLIFDPSHPERDSNLETIARLKPGVSQPQASADIHRAAMQWGHQLGANQADLQQAGWGAFVEPLQKSQVGKVQPTLVVLLGAVGLFLLIACANVANLILVRATEREKEIAIRRAMGASQNRVMRQLLTEGSLLGLGGGVLGGLMAWWGTQAVVAAAPHALPRQNQMGIDGQVLLFAISLSILVSMAAGLVPAWQSCRVNLQRSLRENRSSAGRNRRLARSALVTLEVALSIVLLVGSGLLLGSLYRLIQVDPGYHTQGLLTFRTALPVSSHSHTEVRSLFRQVSERIQALPGVKSVAAISDMPLTPFSTWGWGRVQVERASSGMPGGAPASDVSTIADRYAVTPSYFETVGLTLAAGRIFTSTDNSNAPAVAIVDETLAAQFWPEETAVGQRIATGAAADPHWFTVVGVVRHAKHWLRGQGRPQLYRPFDQTTFHSMHFVVRASVPPATLTSAIRQEVHGVSPLLPVFETQTMNSRLWASLAGERFLSLLLSLFAGLAFLLAMVGLYGVMARSVTQRVHEVGVRVALGAQRRDILRLIVGQGMALALFGLSLGLVAATVLGRFLESFLFGVTPTEPLTFSAISLLVLGVAFLACYVPAQRAAQVDPMAALRSE